MAKYKIQTKDCQITIKRKLSWPDQLNIQDIEFFSCRYIRGLFRIKEVHNNTIAYSGPIAISLYERFKKPVSKYDFFFIMEQIVDFIQKLNMYGLIIEKVELDLRYVFINETTREIQFIYLPIIKPHTGVNIFEFMENIIYSAQPAPEKDMDYISRFTYFLKSLPIYDAQRIEAYIANEDRSVVNRIKNHKVGQSNYMTDKRADYYDHYDKKDEATELLNSKEAYRAEPITGNTVGQTVGNTVVHAAIHTAGNTVAHTAVHTAGNMINNTIGNTLDNTGNMPGHVQGNMVDDEATGLLNDYEATGLLCSEESVPNHQLQQNHFATITRIITKESIPINKPVFRIGKERSYSDYFVNNNDKVSRSHADIVTRGKKTFIVDLNSKNRTFVNGKAIPAQQEIEVFSGDHIRLANEEFVLME